MKLIFINFALNWVYRLYSDYLDGLKEIINKYNNTYNKNIIVNSVFYEIDKEYNLGEELLKLENDNDKIILIGDIGYILNILHFFQKKDLYFLNIEQLSHESYYKYFRHLPENLKIIDYSNENIPFYKDVYKKTFLLPPYFNNKLFYDKDIDVLSIDNNDYRKSILNNIKLDDKYNIKYINNTSNEARDILYNKTKIYINLHCSEKHNTMELIRIINLLYNNVIVITQKSIFDELLFVKNNIIVCNDDNELEKYVSHVLENYSFYYSKFFGTGINKFCKNYYEKYLIKNIELLIND